MLTMRMVNVKTHVWEFTFLLDLIFTLTRNFYSCSCLTQTLNSPEWSLEVTIDFLLPCSFMLSCAWIRLLKKGEDDTPIKPICWPSVSESALSNCCFLYWWDVFIYLCLVLVQDLNSHISLMLCTDGNINVNVYHGIVQSMLWQSLFLIVRILILWTAQVIIKQFYFSL